MHKKVLCKGIVRQGSILWHFLSWGGGGAHGQRVYEDLTIRAATPSII